MMDCFEAHKVISQHRGQAVVVATMTSNFEWPHVSKNPGLDLLFSGAMGKASSTGLGIALARPDKKVIVLDGDGSLLMNLGTLVTIVNMAPPNLIYFVFENNVYRTTGGQPIPLAGKLNFAALARDVGFTKVHAYKELEDLKANISKIMRQKGPVFVSLEVPPMTERPPYPLVKTSDIIDRFKVALQNST